MFECLTSLMVANPLIAPFLKARRVAAHMQNGLLIAVDISKFGDVGDYAREVDRLAEAINPPASTARTKSWCPANAATRYSRSKADGILCPTARGSGWKR